MKGKAKPMAEVGLKNAHPTLFNVGHIILDLLGNPSLVSRWYPIVTTKKGGIILWHSRRHALKVGLDDPILVGLPMINFGTSYDPREEKRGNKLGRIS